MAKFLVELYLDGYDSEEESEKGMEEFIYEQLNFGGSGVTVRKLTKWEYHLLDVYKEKDDAFEKLRKDIKDQK